MKKKMLSNNKNRQKSNKSEPKISLGLTKVGTIIGIIGSIATIIALFCGWHQNKETLKEKAPLLSLKKVDINKFMIDSNKIKITIQNDGQRVAQFKYAYTYVLNTSNKTATAFPTISTIEINPNKEATLDFVQSEATTINPNTYYCTKIWYNDKEINNVEPKELFYQLKIIDGKVISSTIPNEVLKIFKSQIQEYEKSAVFKNPEVES